MMNTTLSLAALTVVGMVSRTVIADGAELSEAVITEWAACAGVDGAAVEEALDALCVAGVVRFFPVPGKGAHVGPALAW